jgi:hypothetical protein
MPLQGMPQFLPAGHFHMHTKTIDASDGIMPAVVSSRSFELLVI